MTIWSQQNFEPNGTSRVWHIHQTLSLCAMMQYIFGDVELRRPPPPTGWIPLLAEHVIEVQH